MLFRSTRGRAAVWQDDQSFWSDVVQKAPESYRAHFHLGYVWAEEQRYGDALREYETAAKLDKPGPDLLMDWGEVYLDSGQTEKALEKFQQSAAVEKTAHVYTQIAAAYAKMSRWQEALDALSTAQTLDPNFAYIYVYRGKIHLATGQCAAAVVDYRMALKVALAGDPAQDAAREDLPKAEACAAGTH